MVHLASFAEEYNDILKAILRKDPTVVSIAFQNTTSPLHVAVACSNIAALELLLRYWKKRYLGEAASTLPPLDL